jgi:hypothetical protein
LDDPQLGGRTYFLEVGNRPMAYTLEEEDITLYEWQQDRQPKGKKIVEVK